MGSVTFRRPLVSDDAAPAEEPGPDWPNEPEGYTLVTEHPFSNASVTNSSSGGGATGWGYAPRSGTFARRENNPPMSSPYSGEGTYGAGFTGGNDLFTIYHGSDKGNLVFLGFVHRYSDNWVGHSSGVNKNVFCWANDQATTYLSAQGSGSGTLNAQLRLQAQAQGSASAPNNALNLEGNTGNSPAIQRGVWHRWELFLQMNTSGQANGIARLWLSSWNGSAWSEPKLVLDYDDVIFDPSGGTFDQVEWVGTWGGIGGTLSESQYQQMDHIRITRAAA